MPTLSKEEMNWISLLLEKTGAMAKDCVLFEDEKIIFLMNKGDTGRVIGKKGSNIKQLSKEFSKEVQVVEYADTVDKMAINSIVPVQAKNIHMKREKNGKNSIIINVSPQDKFRAIGKNGIILKRSRLLLKRHFDIDNVYINVERQQNQSSSNNEAKSVSQN